MVTELFLNVYKTMIFGLMNLIPTVSLDIPNGLMAWLTGLMQGAAYFLPLNHMVTIFLLWATIINIEVIWRIIQRVWDALPFT